MFTTALFAIAKTWKQCKHQQMNGSRKCGIYMQWDVKKERNMIKKRLIDPVGIKQDKKMSETYTLGFEILSS